jgi:hypothetical protein
MLVLFDNGTPRTLARYLIERHTVTEAPTETALLPAGKSGALLPVLNPFTSWNPPHTSAPTRFSSLFLSVNRQKTNYVATDSESTT